MPPDQNVIGPSWRGYSHLRHLVIFGDSYSDIGYEYNKKEFIPSDETPLGIGFPGITWAGAGMPNWVGCLITEYTYNRLLVYDYALGGDTVTGVQRQVRVNFQPGVGEKPSWAPWTAEDTLFITWIGINDCGTQETDSLPRALQDLFEEQECLYSMGARNFLFIDVPPMHRSPMGIQFSSAIPNFRRHYEVWNELLREHTARFSAAHPDITTLLFSSWDTFTRVLDDPVRHGFGPEHVSRPGGDIWVDNLHPSTKMHDWVAHDLSKFLSAQPPYEPTDPPDTATNTVES